MGQKQQKETQMKEVYDQRVTEVIMPPGGRRKNALALPKTRRKVVQHQRKEACPAQRVNAKIQNQKMTTMMTTIAR